MKSQIDWIPLPGGAIRPTQGRTLALMQVSGALSQKIHFF
jgi:arsenic resistance protein ArsH